MTKKTNLRRTSRRTGSWASLAALSTLMAFPWTGCIVQDYASVVVRAFENGFRTFELLGRSLQSLGSLTQTLGSLGVL